jgi:hypothetical protein
MLFAMVNLLQSSEQLFEKLRYDFAEYEADQSSPFKAINFALTAWHLTDWVYHEYEKSSPRNALATSNFTKGKQGIEAMRETFFLECESLKTMHDIATGYKHMTISAPRHRSVLSSNASTVALTASIKDIGLDVEVPPLMIEFTQKSPMLLRDIFQEVLDFWLYYFESKHYDEQQEQ